MKNKILLAQKLVDASTCFYLIYVIALFITAQIKFWMRYLIRCICEQEITTCRCINLYTTVILFVRLRFFQYKLHFYFSKRTGERCTISSSKKIEIIVTIASKHVMLLSRKSDHGQKLQTSAETCAVFPCDMPHRRRCGSEIYRR